MKKLVSAFFAVGAVMALGGALVYITGWWLAPYIYLVGSVLLFVAHVFTPTEYTSPVIRRLRFQQIVGALLLVATGPLMIFLHGNEWIVSLTLAAVFELFTSIRLPQEEAKEKEKETRRAR